MFTTPELIARTFREAQSREAGEIERLRARREELRERVREDLRKLILGQN